MPPSDPFTKDLLLNLLKRIEDLSDTFNTRSDALEDRVGTAIRSLRESVDKRTDFLQAQLTEHDGKIQKHEHLFGLGGWIITAGAGIAATWMTWFSNFFPPKH